MQGIHLSPVDSPHKGQWCGAFVFSLICTLTNGWINNQDPGDLRLHHTYYDISVMKFIGPPIRSRCFTASLHLFPCFSIKTVFLGRRIITIKIWWSLSSMGKDCNCHHHIRVWYMTKIQIYFHVYWYKFIVTRVNSSPPSAAHIRQWIGSALVQIMPCHLFGTKPLSKPTLFYYQLDP